MMCLHCLITHNNTIIIKNYIILSLLIIISKSGFRLSVEKYSNWFCITTLRDWLKNLAPKFPSNQKYM